MKKVLLVLVVPILLLAMISCDSDIMGSINAIKGVLEPLNENVYINTGLYTVDTSQVEAVNTQIATIVSTPSVAPTEATITEIKTALTTVLTSPTKLNALKVEMSQDAGLESTADVSRIEDYLPPGVATDSLTKGDLLAAELIKSVADSTVATKLQSTDPEVVESVTDDEKFALAADALQVIEVVREISSIGEVGVDELVTQLMEQFGMSGGTSRSVESENGDDLMEFLQPIAVAVVTAYGDTALEDDLDVFADTFEKLLVAAKVTEGNILYDTFLGEEGFLTDLDSIFD